MEKDELLNSFSHYGGFIAGCVGAIILINHATNTENLGYLWGCVIYSIGILFIFSMSGTYHILKKGKIKDKFQILDHCAIYVSISASYMPYLLGFFSGPTKWIIFGLQCGITLIGIVFKVFFTGRFNMLSTIIYLIMGWMVVFVISDLKQTITPLSFYFLIASGVVYSIGTIFYSLDKYKYIHFVWHIFVLGGATLGYLSIYYA